jgi:hypothetical protein
LSVGSWRRKQRGRASRRARSSAAPSWPALQERLARTLVATDNASLFGDTEFTVRDLSHGIAAKAYRQHLEQKKTATKAPA